MQIPRNATLTYKSKDIAWVNAGRGWAVWQNDFIPPRGPNGGIMVIDTLALHATLNVTVATAALLGEDKYRAFRTISLTQVDKVKRFDEISGDAARLISYAHLGPDKTHEHPDQAVATADIFCTCALPLSKPYLHSYDDCALPAEMMLELRVGMAQGADLSLGASVVTVNSGSYWVIAECHEEMGIVQHAVDAWRQQDNDTVLTGTLQTGGRLQDAYIFVRGANGGGSLATISEAGIQHLMETNLLREPDLKQYFARSRGEATNLSSTKGNPIRTNPFISSDAGLQRALAVMIATGAKCFDGREAKTEMVRTVQTGGGPGSITNVYRTQLPKSDAIKDILMRTHNVDQSYVKTEGKSRRNRGDWKPELRAYLPEKFFRSKKAA